ncbi:thiazole-phosphate synthase [Salinihabitans flavidus]|uniref:Thiazole synthase n=1 Tax=Salinihabitans flavidus TaxID=569882 RepID=A0A1H8NK73_9RHOB|nr:thiazole synthase [Salinihabitans flavidus]SEO30014.1 thiazole-phosphate synthase [Salinihabitans flavidus]
MRDFYDTAFDTPLMLGTAQYPSPAIMEAAFRASGASVATVSLRREAGQGQAFWDIIRGLGVHVLPNTAGCHSAREAITTARMARDLFETDRIKLEVIGHADTLQPDPFGLLEATEVLAAEGFEVFPYTTEDLVLAGRLVDAGARVLMPWGAPIGSGLGLNNRHGLRTLRAGFPDIAMVVDAGLGLPSHAAAAMEMGFDAVLLNTAVAQAGDPVAMAEAFGLAARAGALAARADAMAPREMATPSTPLIGKAWL